MDGSLGEIRLRKSGLSRVCTMRMSALRRGVGPSCSKLGRSIRYLHAEASVRTLAGRFRGLFTDDPQSAAA